MDLFSRLERALEETVEGVFSRAFRTQLQPIEVAKRLTREMESQRAVSVNTTYVPNVYTVALSPETYAGFQAISARLLTELEEYLREYTTEHQYQTIGPLAVRLAENAELKTGEMLVTAVNDAGATPTAPPAPSVLRSFPSDAAPTAATEEQEHATLIAVSATQLEITAGECVGRVIPLSDGFTIGRGPANALPLVDPGASRQHAAILHTDNQWVLRDTGSTNGTYVNNRRITEHVLRPGDVVNIGETALLVK